MHGGSFGGQMPGRGGFGRDDESFDSGEVNATSAVSLLSAGEPESNPGDPTSEDETPSDLPRGGKTGGTWPEIPEGGLPGFSQNGDDAQPDLTPGNGMFGGRQNGGNIRNPTGTMPGQGNPSQTADAGTPVSTETLILLAVSAVVLLAGCVIAACYKRRG